MKRGIGNEDIEVPELAVPVRKVCFIIDKAHEFDVKVAVTEPNIGSNPSDDNEIAVLQDHADDPVAEELVSLISELVCRRADRPRGADVARQGRRTRGRLGRGSPADRKSVV